MKEKILIAYCFLSLLTIFLPIYSDRPLGPDTRDWEIHRIEDSIFVADSLKYISKGLALSRTNKRYQRQFDQELKSFCSKADIDLVPSIYQWTQTDYTGIGLIRLLFKYRVRDYNYLLFIIPVLFYLSLLFRLLCGLKLINRPDVEISVVWILVNTIMAVMIFLKFPLSFIFYIIFILSLIIDVKAIIKYAG
jgi:hypothetical protein